MITEYQMAATVDQLPGGRILSVEVAGESICLAHIGDEYFAINNICTHMYTRLDQGQFYPATCEIECPLHDSRFNFITGMPTKPPADEPVATYPVRVEGDHILVGPRKEHPA